MKPAIQAVRKLAYLGYRFIVNGEVIKAKYEGPGKPDPAQVRPLLDLVRQHKDDVWHFLNCYCPRCGGEATCPDYGGRPLCLACDWETIINLYPGLEQKH